ICRLFLAPSRINYRKKCTRFGKRGAAEVRTRMHNGRMKTQALLERGSSAAIDLKRILVPVDFSPLSKKAVRYATRLPQQFGAEMNLFHVVEPEIPPAFDGFMIAPPTVSNGSSAHCTGELKTLVNSVRNAGVT